MQWSKSDQTIQLFQSNAMIQKGKIKYNLLKSFWKTRLETAAKKKRDNYKTLIKPYAMSYLLFDLNKYDLLDHRVQAISGVFKNE